MIVMNLRGQLANQMFQLATAYAHSLRMKTSFVVPERSGKRKQFPMMFDHLPKETGGAIRSFLHREKQFGIYEPLPEYDNLHLQGYFQSFKYFNDYRKEVIELFQLPKYEPFYNDNIVSIHVRRTDSLRFTAKLPQPTDKYFHEAIEYFKERGYNDFLVFSDDREYCKKYFTNDRFKDVRFFFSNETNAKNDMMLQAACTHNIIVNSTFSLFSSWLNENPNKIVVSPHKDSWFGEAYKSRLSAQDIVPDEYVQIKY